MLLACGKYRRVWAGGNTFYVQGAKELINVRNSLVHPKPYKSKWEKIDDRKFSVDLGETQFLKLPRSFHLCKYQYALESFKASMAFLNYFFLELCNYSYFKVNDIILGNETESTNLQDWIGIHDKWGVEVDFLIDVCEVKEGEEHFRKHLKEQEEKKNNTDR